ncbi:acetylcholine receptor subunit alpha [Elysia marginata]|uniref:Acetylcholine receptor subunit alpha n=1 Tax=Elysia marginata TaxID=1093978 RepID=A0AAV4IGD7_9GAST|nr:acetylcholine receptor subunit alpha [Elysia marginata]
MGQRCLNLDYHKEPRKHAASGASNGLETVASTSNRHRAVPLAFYLMVVFLFWLSDLPACVGVQREEFKPLKLMDDLFQNYSTLVTPRLDPTQSVDLNCFVNYVSLLSLDNLEQEMTSQLVINFVWIDELLRWNPQDYDNIR